MTITRPDAPRGFVTRLADENGWTIERAEAADREYRRFLALAAATNETIVPSRDVDAAWHEHLLHTRHYWDVACRDILGRAFHHDPGDGGEGDARDHARGYLRTLELYEEAFGAPAPSDVWPRGCTCRPASPPPAVTLAMPAWTVLGALAILSVVVIGGAIGSIMAIWMTAAAAATAASPSTRRREERRRGGARGTVAIAKPRRDGGSARRRGSEGRRDGNSSDGFEGVAATFLQTDAGDAHATTTHHASSDAVGHGHSCGQSSCGGTTSCGGASSCGGSGCGGGGCGGG